MELEYNFHPPNPTLTYQDLLPLLMPTDPLVRCPACGSALTSTREDPEIWECRYCYAVFPVESLFLVRGFAFKIRGTGHRREKEFVLNFYPLHREINILFLDGLPSGVLGEAVRLLR